MAYDMMDDESAPSSAEADEQDTKKDSNDDNKSDETEDQLALVPKSFFKDEMKPGDREMVEVMEIYDDEVSIRCVYGDKDDKGGKEERESSYEDKSESEPEDSMMT